jgi:hypothetical protein
MAMLALGVVGPFVLSVYLYPDLRSGALGVADGEVLFVVMIMAFVSMMIWPAIAMSSRFICGRLAVGLAFGDEANGPVTFRVRSPTPIVGRIEDGARRVPIKGP